MRLSLAISDASDQASSLFPSQFKGDRGDTLQNTRGNLLNIGYDSEPELPIIQDIKEECESDCSTSSSQIIDCDRYNCSYYGGPILKQDSTDMIIAGKLSKCPKCFGLYIC